MANGATPEDFLQKRNIFVAEMERTLRSIKDLTDTVNKHKYCISFSYNQVNFDMLFG